MKSRREVVDNKNFLIFMIVMSLFFVVVCSIVFGSVRTAAASADVNYKYYTSVQIQDGDTLWNIAKTYYTEEFGSISDYIQEVCSINHILSDDEIHSGQYVTVPYYSHNYLE